MIPITPQREPSQFHKEVRIPGRCFLKSCPSPRGKAWEGHEYWRKFSREFYQCYLGICAYTGCWFSNVPTKSSVDHYRPKSKYPQLAYEWDNYRLTTREINTRKGDDDEIADPFEIKHGWFVLGLPDCLIRPGADISPQERRMVQHTIDTLKLNDDDDYPNERQNIIQSYIDGSLDLDCLRRRYPFIAYELKRQNLLSVEKLKLLFKKPT